MNYFIRSLWFGALLTPKCWGCALMRNPAMVLFFASVMFFLIGFSNETFFFKALITFVFWLLGMVLFIITPRRYYRVKYHEQELLLFFYDNYTKLNVCINDTCRAAILRVFEKDEKGWRKSGENTFVQGYDDTLELSGFILVRLPYAAWIAFGNGYHQENNNFFLGRKIDDYAFISDAKNPKLHFIHGNAIVTTDILSCEKCSDVFASLPYVSYKKVQDDGSGLSTPPESTAGEISGNFFLIQKEDGFHLFKAITSKGICAVYEVFIDWFHIRKKGQTRVFFKNPQGTYSLSRKADYSRVE